MTNSVYRLVFIQAIALVFASQSIQASDTSKRIDTEYYSVKGNEVDADTFLGYTTYHQTCVRCHGVGGTGSPGMPDLTQAIDRMSPARFKIKVLHRVAIRFSPDDWHNLEQAMFEEIRKQEQRNNKEMATMPRWENNPMVGRNVMNIYRYLKARADGVLGPEKPEILSD